ncbi:AT-rich interactive domain-containing protein 6-like [Mangifera indica]|uniref:AT-rich interactive domain-containing protein 6-like n=1 Tax=Mangifera indica TaxID=29780 RepID=UPI001CFA63B1|nr:AT-rich interactive domain-containing protein 6-like [Mangifera indica]XP_044470244.1 AT-rich interactive domain-containing protein 6-like [Mangifera indica]
MTSNTLDKENEEPAQGVPVSSNNEGQNSINPQVEASRPVPLAVEVTNPVLPEDQHPLNGTNTATDANNFEKESTSHKELSTCVALGATGGSDKPDIQLPHVVVKAESNEAPGDKPQDQVNEVPDIKTLAHANEVPDAKTEVETNEVPVTVTLVETTEIPNSINTVSTNSEAPNNAFPTSSEPPKNTISINSELSVYTVSSNSETPANPEAERSSQALQTKFEPATPKPDVVSADIKPDNANSTEIKSEVKKIELSTPTANENSNSTYSFLLDDNYEGSESGTEEEQSAFMKELEKFFRERSMEFKPPKFYGEGLNCLKLWRAVTRLGGYDKVTSCKLWRQVGESFKPPKTCTTVSWTFRGFYEKALLDYERHKTCGGELSFTVASQSEPMNMNIDNQASGSGRARRDAAARAMQGWHSQRVLGNGEVSDPIIKDKNAMSVQKREKQLGLLKRKKPSYIEQPVKAARTKPSKPQLDIAIVDIGQPADWVKINVQKTKDCFEVYALVPGLLREEVRVQSDPAGRLVISGEPEHPDNPWGVTPFKKVVSLPARIDPHQTSAVVTLHGQLFVRVPFEPSD